MYILNNLHTKIKKLVKFSHETFQAIHRKETYVFELQIKLAVYSQHSRY